MLTQPEDDSDLFDGFGNGSLHMYVACTPGWEPYGEGDSRYLDLDFHYSDWEALFYDGLYAARWDQYVEGEGVDVHTERNRRKFHESIPDFPRLRTIFDMYEDYLFELQEAVELRDECYQAKNQLNHEAADKALRKIIYGCDKAIEANCSLMFVCD